MDQFTLMMMMVMTKILKTIEIIIKEKYTSESDVRPTSYLTQIGNSLCLVSSGNE